MLKYKIDGIFFDDIEKQDIELTYGGEGLQANISNVRLFFDAKNLINQLVSNLDVFRKIPFEIYYNNDVIYSGYFSFRELHNLADACEYIELEAVNEGIRSLEDIADSVTLIGSNVSYIQVPYQLSSIPDKQAIAIALTGLFLTGYILQEQITQLVEHITLTTSNPFTINAALLIAIRVAYITTLLIALIKYVIDLIDALIPDVEHCKAINLTDAINIMLNRVGYNLASDFLFNYPYKDLAIILARDNNGNIIDNSTLRDLLDIVKRLFNCDIEVIGDIVRINKNNNVGNASIVIDNYSLVERSIDLTDCPSSILLRFSYDASDKNTVNNGVGNSVQALFERHGEAIVNEINLARAKRKDELIKIEKILRDLLKIVDNIVNAMINAVNGVIDAINVAISGFNRLLRALRSIGIRLNINLQPIPRIDKPNLSKSISDRIGNLLVEADTWGVNKLALLDGNKLAVNNKDVVNAKHFYDNFYSQRYIYEKITIEISACYDTMRKLIDEKMFILDGKTYKLVELSYNINSTIMRVVGKSILANDIPENQIIIN